MIKATKQLDLKRGGQRNFRPSDKIAEMLEVAQRLNFNVSGLINETLEAHFADILKRKVEALQKEMVRGGGFEPPTPTVSR